MIPHEYVYPATWADWAMEIGNEMVWIGWGAEAFHSMATLSDALFDGERRDGRGEDGERSVGARKSDVGTAAKMGT